MATKKVGIWKNVEQVMLLEDVKDESGDTDMFVSRNSVVNLLEFDPIDELCLVETLDKKHSFYVSAINTIEYNKEYEMRTFKYNYETLMLSYDLMMDNKRNYLLARLVVMPYDNMLLGTIDPTPVVKIAKRAKRAKKVELPAFIKGLANFIGLGVIAFFRVGFVPYRNWYLPYINILTAYDNMLGMSIEHAKKLL